MKTLFDTNVYVSEAMRGKAATAIIEATEQAGWRMYASTYLLDELERVTNDRHLLSLDPYEGIQIVTINWYERMLREQGILRD